MKHDEHLFREFSKQKPMTAKELHELMKIDYLKNTLYDKVGEGILSQRENLKHFSLDALKTKRPDIFKKLSEEVKFLDRERNKKLNEQGDKYE